MPLSRQQFDHNLSNEQTLYLVFLKKNPDTAYTVEELCSELGFVLPVEPMARSIYLWARDLELKALVQRGLLESKVLGFNTYFALKR